MKHASLQKCIAVVLALAVWQGAAMAVGMDLLLPSPWQVAQRLWTVWQEPDFFPTVAFSLLRISGGFGLGLVLGVLLAVAAGRLRVLEILLWPYVTVIKSVPVASFIIICLIWLNTSQLAVFISFLMVFPAIYSNTLQGIRSADPALLEMARLYRVPFSRRLGYIYVPQVKPFLLSGCSVALGMSWKSGVAAEVIGVVGGSIGIGGMWVLLALTVGGNLMGITGMVLGIPAFAVIYALVKEFCDKRIAAKDAAAKAAAPTAETEKTAEG